MGPQQTAKSRTTAATSRDTLVRTAPARSTSSCPWGWGEGEGGRRTVYRPPPQILPPSPSQIPPLPLSDPCRCSLPQLCQPPLQPGGAPHPPSGAPAGRCLLARGAPRPGPGGAAWPRSRHRWRPAATGRAPAGCRARRRARGRGWGRPRCSKCAAQERGGAGRAPEQTRPPSLHHRRC